MRAKYCFEVARVPVMKRVRVAAIHLDGRALQWHRGFASSHGDLAYVDWGCVGTTAAEDTENKQVLNRSI